MMPAAPVPEVPDNHRPPVDAERPVYRWYHMLGSAALIGICTGMGFFLLIFPWSGFWEANSFVLQVPEAREYWSSPYLRGAISGLGLVNLIFALVDLIRFRRFFEP
ncbi:MAG: hypothetical protein WBL61_21710 [Bryobacteraceae bacterium]